MSTQVVVSLVAEEGKMFSDRGKRRRRTAIGNPNRITKHWKRYRESSFVQSAEAGGRSR